MAYSKCHQNRIDKGICLDCCGEIGKDGTKTTCRKCADKRSKSATLRVRRKRERFKKENGCNQCGKKKENDNMSLCKNCQRLARENYQKTSKTRKLKYKKEKRCINCGKDVFQKSRYCKKHWVYNFVKNCNLKINSIGCIFSILERQEFKCYYTGIKLVAGDNASIDHLSPVSRYPHLKSDISNFVWCDKRINLMKGNFTESEFKKICSDITSFTV